MVSTISEDLKPLKERMEETKSEKAAALYAIALSIASLNETIREISTTSCGNNVLEYLANCHTISADIIKKAIEEIADIIIGTKSP